MQTTNQQLFISPSFLTMTSTDEEILSTIKYRKPSEVRLQDNAGPSQSSIRATTPATDVTTKPKTTPTIELDRRAFALPVFL